MAQPRVRLGELLVKSGLITQEQLAEALQAQRRDGRRLGTLLVEIGLVTETQVTQILSQQLSVPWVSLQHIDFSRQLLDLVPATVVERYCLVPIYVRHVRGLGDALYVAMDDPTNEAALHEVSQHSGMGIRAMIAPPSDIRAAIRTHYGIGDFEENTDVHSVRSPDEPVVKTEGAIRAPQQSGVDLKVPESTPSTSEEEPSSAKKKAKLGREPRVISLTLLDGTKIDVPARPGDSRAVHEAMAEGSGDDQATARDIVAALRAAAHGADASDVLGESVRWEAMVAALLSLLLKKRLITDLEFIDELKKG